jgi:hypothetical protein
LATVRDEDAKRSDVCRSYASGIAWRGLRALDQPLCKQALEDLGGVCNWQAGWGQRIYVDGDVSRARAAPVPWKNGNAWESDAARGYDVVDLVGHLRFVVLVLNGTVIVIQNA